MTGGAGADVFQFSSADGVASNVIINDFVVNTDALQVVGISVNTDADADVDGDTLVDDTLITIQEWRDRGRDWCNRIAGE